MRRTARRTSRRTARRMDRRMSVAQAAAPPPAQPVYAAPPPQPAPTPAPTPTPTPEVPSYMAELGAAGVVAGRRRADRRGVRGERSVKFSGCSPGRLRRSRFTQCRQQVVVRTGQNPGPAGDHAGLDRLNLKTCGRIDLRGHPIGADDVRPEPEGFPRTSKAPEGGPRCCNAASTDLRPPSAVGDCVAGRERQRWSQSPSPG